MKGTRSTLPGINSARGPLQGRGEGIVQLSLVQVVSGGSHVVLFFHSTGSMIPLTSKLIDFKSFSRTSRVKTKQEITITSQL